MPKAYIAGPMRGHPQSNFPAFDRAAALGRSLGWEIISPAEMDRAAGDNAEAEPLPFNGGSPEVNRRFARRDVEEIMSLRAENGDVIALLPGWQTSTAAPAEVALARWVKLGFVDARTFLPLKVELVGQEIRPPLPAAFQSCGLEGGCGCDEDLARHSLILIAQDFADRETL